MKKKTSQKLICVMVIIILSLCVTLFLFLHKETKVENVRVCEEVTVQEVLLEDDDAEVKDIEIEYVDRRIREHIRDEAAGTIIDAECLILDEIERYFTQNEIDDEIFMKINGKSYPQNARISLDELRYIKVLHYNYNHEIQVGELIVNAGIAQDIVNIFQELFEIEYEVESMRLIDEFWTGDSVDSDTNSIAHNNTSAFNYRVVPGTDHLSNHARGRAIDINPLQNPYVKYKSDGSFAHYYKDMELYLDRNSGKPHLITHQDECYQIFRKYGFTWGGDWNSVKDYQHFEKE